MWLKVIRTRHVNMQRTAFRSQIWFYFHFAHWYCVCMCISCTPFSDNGVLQLQHIKSTFVRWLAGWQTFHGLYTLILDRLFLLAFNFCIFIAFISHLARYFTLSLFLLWIEWITVLIETIRNIDYIFLIERMLQPQWLVCNRINIRTTTTKTAHIQMIVKQNRMNT